MKEVRKLFGCAVTLALFASCDTQEQGSWQVIGETQQGSARQGSSQASPQTPQTPQTSQTPQTPEPSGSQAPALLKTMAIHPAYSKLLIGQNVQLAADVWLWDGAKIGDVTDQFRPSASSDPEFLTWVTDNFGIATVDAFGFVTALSAGETLIRARCRDREAIARVAVEATESHDPNIDVITPPLP